MVKEEDSVLIKVDKLDMAYLHICKILINDKDETDKLSESVRISLYRVKNLLFDYAKGKDEQPTNHEG